MKLELTIDEEIDLRLLISCEIDRLTKSLKFFKDNDCPVAENSCKKYIDRLLNLKQKFKHKTS